MRRGRLGGEDVVEEEVERAEAEEDEDEEPAMVR